MNLYWDVNYQIDGIMKNKTNHLLQIDILKGLAMIFVIIIHSIVYTDHSKIFKVLAEFTIAQAVPIFLVIMGLNLGYSFKRKNYTNLKQIFSKNYFVSRFERLYFPFIIICVISILVAILAHKQFQISLLILIGKIPLFGYGDFFVYLIFQFIVLFPILYVLYKRNPLGMLASSFIINFSFEVFVFVQSLLNQNISYYNYVIIRYLFLINLGLWVSDRLDFNKVQFKDIFDQKNIVMSIGLIISCIYLFIATVYSYKFPFFIPDWAYQKLFSNFYTLFIVIVGLKYLPSVSNNIIPKSLALIGKASYHIFLLQIVIFGAGITFSNVITKIGLDLTDFSNLFELLVVLINLMMCLSFGLLFFYSEGKLSRYLFKNK